VKNFPCEILDFQRFALSACSVVIKVIDDKDDDAAVNIVERLAQRNATSTSYGGRDCRGLRSKRYLSDGFCRTLRPISEVLCSGSCVLDDHEALYPSVVSSWGRATGGRAVEWRCVDDEIRHRRVRLFCENGDVRVYRVRVVRSCACQRHQRRVTSSQRHHRRHRRRHRQRATSP